MSIVIFTGPTLSADEAARVLDATYLPPAGQGDVYRVARRKPRAIGIIDGTFETSPAVWHKEVLWALSEGIHVFGSASMGALRAAELATFGMEGVGVVYEWFRAGIIEDDDEVAVAHADASYAYRMASEAMVNVRATIEAAKRARVIGNAAAEVVIRSAKCLHYRERNYPNVLRNARRDGASSTDIDQLTAFLRDGRVNQKRDDAVSMLEVMRSRQSTFERPKERSFRFEHTEAWDQCMNGVKDEVAREEYGAAPSALLEEIRLRDRGGIFRRALVLRALAEHEAKRAGTKLTAQALAVAQEAFRREHGLEDADVMQRWLARNRLSPAAFQTLLDSEAKLRWLETVYASDDGAQLLAELAASGELEVVRTRAAHKEEVLRARALNEPDPSDTGMEVGELLTWFFHDRLKRQVPKEFGAYLRENGYGTLQLLIRDALREYLYLKLVGEG